MRVHEVATDMDGEPRPLLGGSDELEQSSILADPRHRRILSILQTQSEPIPVDELCRRLAAAEGDGTSAVDRRSIRTDLRHRCLPNLEAVGWIDRRPDGIRFDDRRFAETVDISPAALAAPDDPVWEVVAAILARTYRRTILSIVADDGAITVGDLAAELRERTDGTGAARSEDGRLPLALHHVDLPKLAAIGVIEYDRAEKTVDATRRLRPCLDRLEPDTG